jgi:sugar lactone lactonase YvrE
VTEGLRFAEAPRWRGDRLWFSDVHDYKLKTVTPDGAVDVVAEVPGRPSGLGFLPDGALLMATALDRRLVRVDVSGDLTEVADLSGTAQGVLNDMVVDGRGRAYVGDTGFDMAKGEPPRPGRVLVWEDGRDAHVAAEDVVFPNGCAITPDGATFLLAETMASRVTRFGIAEDGTLTDREQLADLGSPPDGLCLDAENAVWMAQPHRGEFVRVLANGSVDRRVPSRAPFAVTCVLGGPDRLTLFLCSADTDLDRLRRGDTAARIDALRVDVPGAGWP